ncbi:MAG: anaerobic ribonucleoside-triphosphate reductase [Coriobacteriia bacterium]|nr:anaerobic ribonucleoside-triphosphate reductase [Coriobacteriia bacterium]
MTKTVSVQAAMDSHDDAFAVVLDDVERQPCEIWTRVMGYHRPVSSFNVGKQGEYAERTCFVEPAIG